MPWAWDAGEGGEWGEEGARGHPPLEHGIVGFTNAIVEVGSTKYRKTILKKK